MKPFKFLSNNQGMVNTITVEFLLEYNRRLDYHYVYYHRIFNRSHPHNQASCDLYDRTNQFIREGQLTTPTEVRRYVDLSYKDITGDDYGIGYRDSSSILDDTYDFLNGRRNETI